MPIQEIKLQLGEDELYYSVKINCDLCNLQMYYNEVRNIRIIHTSKNGIYICSICARKILIESFKKKLP